MQQEVGHESAYKRGKCGLPVRYCTYSAISYFRPINSQCLVTFQKLNIGVPVGMGQ